MIHGTEAQKASTGYDGKVILNKVKRFSAQGQKW